MLYKHKEAIELAKQWHYNTVIGVIYAESGEEDSEESGKFGVFYLHNLLFDNRSSSQELKELMTYFDNAPGDVTIRVTLFKDNAFEIPENDDNKRVLHVSCQLSRENIKNMKEFNIDAFTITINAAFKELLYALLK